MQSNQKYSKDLLHTLTNEIVFVNEQIFFCHQSNPKLLECDSAPFLNIFRKMHFYVMHNCESLLFSFATEHRWRGVVLYVQQSSLFRLLQYASCEIAAVHFPTFVSRWGVRVAGDAFNGYTGKVLLTVLLLMTIYVYIL